MNGKNDRETGANTDLILFVTGDSPRSLRARANLATAVEDIADNRLTVRHIDLLQDTSGVAEYGIFATPALIHVRASGEPAVLYGDLSNGPELERFLANLQSRETA